MLNSFIFPTDLSQSFLLRSREVQCWDGVHHSQAARLGQILGRSLGRRRREGREGRGELTGGRGRPGLDWGEPGGWEEGGEEVGLEQILGEDGGEHCACVRPPAQGEGWREWRQGPGGRREEWRWRTLGGITISGGQEVRAFAAQSFFSFPPLRSSVLEPNLG